MLSFAQLGGPRPQRYVLFESYIIDDDEVGRRFAAALVARARAGLRVCVICDWLGSFGAGALWATLREGGVDAVSYTHLRAHETVLDLVCRLLLEKKKRSIR